MSAMASSRVLTAAAAAAAAVAVTYAAHAMKLTRRQREMLSLCRALPKAELHAHLHGSIRLETLEQLLPVSARTSEHAMQALHSPKERSLRDCFAIFALIHEAVTTTSAVRRVTKEVLRDFADDNVKYLELRTTPRALVDADMEGYVRTVLSVFAEFEASEGASAVWPMTPRLLLSVDRSKGVEAARCVVQLAKRLAEESGDGGAGKYIVGVDFSGNPHRGAFSDFAPSFEDARNSGLKVAMHCAEVDVPEDTAEEIAFAPDRLGHALFLTPSHVQTLQKLRIPIEICPTSNLKTLHLDSVCEHPTLGRWLSAGYPVSINTDDSGVFSTDASAELCAAGLACALTAQQVVALSVAPLDHCFEPDKPALRALRERFRRESAFRLAQYQPRF